MKSNKDIINFLFEAGILAKTPRSGFHFLGSGTQSVAEHLHRAAIVAYALAKLDGTVDAHKVVTMALFHDFAEGRTSDLNYVHQKYVKSREEDAVQDLVDTLPFGGDLKDIVHEYEERESRESILVKEADNLEWILSLKEQVDTGNARAEEWIGPAVKRFKTDIAKDLAQMILETNSSEWWFGDGSDEWWINRNK